MYGVILIDNLGQNFYRSAQCEFSSTTLCPGKKGQLIDNLAQFFYISVVDQQRLQACFFAAQAH
jgi:hypothetical protein